MHLIACDYCGKRFKNGEDILEAGIAIQHGNGTVSGHPGDPAHLHGGCVTGYVQVRLDEAVPEPPQE